MRRNQLLSLLFATLAAINSGPAAAKAIIRSDCLSYISAQSKLTYNRGGHEKWYRNYWDGQCKGLWFCTTQIGWNTRIDELKAQGTPSQQSAILDKACRLGELVGYEWAKDNNIRCIHSTGDHSLSTLADIMKNKSQDLMVRLNEVRRKVEEWCPEIKAPTPR
jgi:hypothetical protein